MVRCAAFACLVVAACGSERGPGDCTQACSGGEVCRYQTCVAQPTACTANAGCTGDRYCETGTMECLPWGVGPGGVSDSSCHVSPAPGVFFPAVQCEWAGPPADDAF